MPGKQLDPAFDAKFLAWLLRKGIAVTLGVPPSEAGELKWMVPLRTVHIGIRKRKHGPFRCDGLRLYLRRTLLESFLSAARHYSVGLNDGALRIDPLVYVTLRAQLRPWEKALRRLLKRRPG